MRSYYQWFRFYILHTFTHVISILSDRFLLIVSLRRYNLLYKDFEGDSQPVSRNILCVLHYKNNDSKSEQNISTPLGVTTQCHQPYTLKSRSTKIRSKYLFSGGLHTVLHYSQEIVLKYFVYREKIM